MATQVRSARGEATPDICIYLFAIRVHALLHGHVVNGGTNSLANENVCLYIWFVKFPCSVFGSTLQRPPRLLAKVVSIVYFPPDNSNKNGFNYTKFLFSTFSGNTS